MDQTHPDAQPSFSTVPQAAEDFGSVPNPAEPFGNVPQGSEGYGTIPQASEPFRTVPNPAATRYVERKATHTLTVREVARLFEAAGVARTERSITNWCRPTAQGIARLDAWYDPNERRYYVTPESVERAIAEEQARARRTTEAVPHAAEGEDSQSTGHQSSHQEQTHSGHRELDELRKDNLDLKITNRAKDQFIDLLQKERSEFAGERERYVQQLVAASRQLGELEQRLLQLDDGGMTETRRVEALSNPEDGRDTRPA
jgi:hypothetical protein